MVRILRQLGYQVLEASDGPRALECSARWPGPIDLVLTDVIMPGMNGRQLAERLTALRPGLRVLFTSGYPEDVIAQHGVVEPGLRFLPKPYSPATLARHVRDALDERS